jgi:hypothetical protein
MSAIKLGAVAKAKNNRVRRTTNEHFLVVEALSGPAGLDQLTDVGVYERERDARDVGVHLADGADKDATKDAYEEALAKRVHLEKGASRTILRGMVADLSDLLAGGGDEGASPLIGKKVSIACDVLDGSGVVIGRRDGEVVVKAARGPGIFVCGFEFEGEDREVLVSEALIKAAMTQCTVSSQT